MSGPKLQNDENVKRRRTGGRSAVVLTSVADAVMDELVASGVEDFSVPRVAARAGVNSSSIYRRWATKGELISFAATRWAETMMPTPDLGKLALDLVRVLEDGARFITDPRGRALVSIGFSDRGESQDQTAQASYWQQRLSRHQAIFDRAIERKEISPETDTQEILEFAIGALYARTFISRRPVTRAYLRRAVNAALTIGVAARRNARNSKTT